MPIILKTGESTTVTLNKSKNLSNGVVLQHVGNTFQDIHGLTLTENIGKTGTAKGRASIRVPYPATEASPAGFAFANVEFSVPAECPVVIATTLPYLLASLAATDEFKAMILQRSVLVA